MRLLKLRKHHMHNGRMRQPGEIVKIPSCMSEAMINRGDALPLSDPEHSKARAQIREKRRASKTRQKAAADPQKNK